MIKREHKEVPPAHYFPDGSKISYWRSNSDDLIYGQLVSKQGRLISGKFLYLGDTP